MIINKIMKTDNKVVYIHRRKDNYKVFYVGMGNLSRSKSTTGRNKHWKSVVKKAKGYYIQIVESNLTKEDALELEVFIISEYGLGNLTNITKGGECGRDNGISVFNIDTGEVFESILKASVSVKQPSTTITDQLNGYSNIKQSNRIRRIEDPYPQNTEFWKGVNSNEVNLCEGASVGYEPVYDITLFDDKETEILNKIKELDDDIIEMIELSYSMSVREVADYLNINYGYVYRYIKNARESVLGDRINEYKNKSNKHLHFQD